MTTTIKLTGKTDRQAYEAWLRRRYACYIEPLSHLDATAVAYAARNLRLLDGASAEHPTVEAVAARASGEAPAAKPTAFKRRVG